MSPSVGTASLDLLIDKDQLGRSIGSAASAQAGAIKSHFGALGKIAGAALGASAAFEGINLIKSSLGEAREAAEMGRRTTAVLKSMGDGAGVSAKHVGVLADQLSNMAGVDDEVIQGGENLLLTFGRVQQRMGKGNNIFDRATKAALNMSAAVGGDLQGAITQIGKALQDPAKGAVALAKAGSLSRDELGKLKDMAKAGAPVLEQQRFILSALEKQYGGTAAASADAGKKLGVAWGNIQEKIGSALLPILNKLATFLTVTAIPKIGEFASAIGRGFRDPTGSTNATGWTKTFEDIGRTAHNLADDAERVGTFLKEKVGPPLKDVLGFIGDNLNAVLAAWGAFKVIATGTKIVDTVTTAYRGLGVALGATGVAGGEAAAGIGAANTAAASSAGPWAIAIGAGVGLGVVLHNLIEDHFPSVNRWLESLGAKVFDFGVWWAKAWREVGANVVDSVASIGNAWSSLWDGIKRLAAAGVNFVIDKINGLISAFNSVTGFLDKITPGHVGKVGAIPHVGGGAPALGQTFNFGGGTGYAAGGWMAGGTLGVVGENGPEFRYEPSGARIVSHADTMRALHQSVSSGVSSRPQTVVLEVDGRTLGRLTSTALRDYELMGGLVPWKIH
jgi:hypothetical protein